MSAFGVKSGNQKHLELFAFWLSDIFPHLPREGEILHPPPHHHKKKKQLKQRNRFDFSKEVLKMKIQVLKAKVMNKEQLS